MKTKHEIESEAYAIEMKSAWDTYATAHHAIRGVYLDALKGPSVTKLVEALEFIASDQYKVVPSHYKEICEQQMKVAKQALEEWRK